MRRRADRNERGAIAVLAAIVLLAVGGFLALALNVGHKMTAKTQLQAAFDSAALAGARALNGTPRGTYVIDDIPVPAGVDGAEEMAYRFARQHYLDSEQITLSRTNDIKVGYWDAGTRKFFPERSTITIGDKEIELKRDLNPQFFNAVRVGAVTDGSENGHNEPLDVWFGAFVGSSTQMKVAASAVAVNGGPCAESGCLLPLAIPSCAIVDSGGFILCNTRQTLNFNFGHGKQVAFIDVSQPSRTVTNAEEVQQMGAGADCRNTQLKIGDVVATGNGSDFNNPVEKTMYEPTNIVCSGPDAVPPYTACPHRQVAIVNLGPFCTDPMVQRTTIVGFARVVVLATRNANAGEPAIDVWVDCSGESPNPGGCANFGLSSPTLRLVQ